MNNFFNVLAKVAVAGACVIGFGSAQAATDNSTMLVTATVGTTCALGSGAAINFANYDPSSLVPAQANTGTTLRITCNGGTTWSLFSTQAVATAIMQNTLIATATAMYQMPYALYADAAYKTLLPITNVAGVITGVGTGAVQNPVIYAQVAPKLNVFTGAYAQTVNLTIVY